MIWSMNEPLYKFNPFEHMHLGPDLTSHAWVVNLHSWASLPGWYFSRNPFPRRKALLFTEEFSKLPNAFSRKFEVAQSINNGGTELLVPNALSSPFSRFRIAKAPGPIYGYPGHAAMLASRWVLSELRNHALTKKSASSSSALANVLHKTCRDLASKQICHTCFLWAARLSSKRLQLCGHALFKPAAGHAGLPTQAAPHLVASGSAPEHSRRRCKAIQDHVHALIARRDFAGSCSPLLWKACHVLRVDARRQRIHFMGCCPKAFSRHACKIHHRAATSLSGTYFYFAL